VTAVDFVDADDVDLRGRKEGVQMRSGSTVGTAMLISPLLILSLDSQ